MQYFIMFLVFEMCAVSVAQDDKPDPYEKIKKKNILDYTDADMERLFEQWEVLYTNILALNNLLYILQLNVCDSCS